eukprot:3210510-Amphidinium_carterae.1
MQSSQSNSEHGLLLTCLSVRRNVVPSVLTRCEFWFFLVFHTIVTVCYKRGLLPGAEDRLGHPEPAANKKRIPPKRGEAVCSKYR